MQTKILNQLTKQNPAMTEKKDPNDKVTKQMSKIVKKGKWPKNQRHPSMVSSVLFCVPQPKTDVFRISFVLAPC